MGLFTPLLNAVSTRVAFFPPNPASYTVESHTDAPGELYIQPTDRAYPKVLQAQVERLRTPRVAGGGGTDILAAWLPYSSAGRTTKRTLLFSHGNAVDLGQMLPVFRDLGRLLAVNVAAYDYTGYGPPCDPYVPPSMSHALADIQAVFEHLVQRRGLQPADIILYGQSVGSGPPTWLAARQPQLAGLVLHSPLHSGTRVLNPGLRFWPGWLDVFPNHVHLPNVAARTLVMHGTRDEVIDISCGRALQALARNPHPPLWADGFGHQDLERCPEYLPSLRAFIAACFDGAAGN